LPKALIDDPVESFIEMHSETHRAAINWKTYLDQFNEYYHVPPVHAPNESVGLEFYTALPAHNMTCMKAPANAAFYGGKWLWGWPNWTLAVLPGGMKISRVEPISPQEVAVHFHFFFSGFGRDDEATQRRVIDATKAIFEQDVRACERAQANYDSRAYQPGPLHPRHEQSTAYFQERVRAALRRTL
jgi:choline monooxygenase